MAGRVKRSLSWCRIDYIRTISKRTPTKSSHPGPVCSCLRYTYPPPFCLRPNGIVRLMGSNMREELHLSRLNGAGRGGRRSVWYARRVRTTVAVQIGKHDAQGPTARGIRRTLLRMQEIANLRRLRLRRRDTTGGTINNHSVLGRIRR